MSHLYKIGSNAFRQVGNGAEDALKFTNNTMILPGSITTIGYSAFYNLSCEHSDNGQAYGRAYDNRGRWISNPLTIQFGGPGDPSQLILNQPYAETSYGIFDIVQDDIQISNVIIYADSTRIIDLEQGTSTTLSFDDWVNSSAFDATLVNRITTSVIPT